MERGIIFEAARLLNARRLDGDALAAVGTDELDQLVNAGSHGGSVTVRTADRHTGGRRLEEALSGRCVANS
jgi:hypothetical protein